MIIVYDPDINSWIKQDHTGVQRIPYNNIQNLIEENIKKFSEIILINVNNKIKLRIIRINDKIYRVFFIVNEEILMDIHIPKEHIHLLFDLVKVNTTETLFMELGRVYEKLNNIADKNIDIRWVKDTEHRDWILTFIDTHMDVENYNKLLLIMYADVTFNLVPVNTEFGNPVDEFWYSIFTVPNKRMNFDEFLDEVTKP